MQHLPELLNKNLRFNKLGLFVYDPEEETFSLVFSYGLGKLKYKFKPDKQDLWHTILAG